MQYIWCPTVEFGFDRVQMEQYVWMEKGTRREERGERREERGERREERGERREESGERRGERSGKRREEHVLSFFRILADVDRDPSMADFVPPPQGYYIPH
jgi:hypothetical protein